MKLLWKIYYIFVKPSTLVEVTVRYCRINGKPYKKLPQSIVKPEDFEGDIKWNE